MPEEIVTFGRKVSQWFADIRPAATMMIVAGLIRPEMKIEIEATAFRNPG